MQVPVHRTPPNQPAATALSPTSKEMLRDGLQVPEDPETARLKANGESAAAVMRVTSRIKSIKKMAAFTNTGSGTYDIESLDSIEFGGGGGHEGHDQPEEGDDEHGDSSDRMESNREEVLEEEDEKMLEELEDKQLMGRLGNLESGESTAFSLYALPLYIIVYVIALGLFKLTEQVWKLEHDRTWVENRLTSLEDEFNITKKDEKAAEEK